MPDDQGKNKKTKRSFLIRTENFHPTVLKHLKGREDLLTFRQLQGEMAKYYRLLLKVQNIAKNQKFSITLPLNENVSGPGPGAASEALLEEIDGDKEEQNMSETIANDIIVNHLNAALEEIKAICLDLLLEEIEEIPTEGSVEELFQAKEELLKKKKQ